MIRVLLADDHQVVRSGVKMLLETNPDIVVIGEAADGIQAYNLVMQEKPDVVFMDISMPPGQSGLSVCERISTNCPETRVIMLTMFTELEYMIHAMRCGAAGYMPKSSTAEELLDAVSVATSGRSYVHPCMQEKLTKYLAEGRELEMLFKNDLSIHEIELIKMLARGYTNKEISEQLFISVKTVEAQRAKIMQKLNLKSRADLVDYAIKHKYLDL